MTQAVWILLFSPLFGFIFNSVYKWNARTSVWIGCTSSFLSFVSAVYLFYILYPVQKPHTITMASWIQQSHLDVSFSTLIDPLSLIMSLIVTGVGFLIHLFSAEYMKNDSRIRRYFSYLNLFIFNMLILILADNLLFLFVGWEGVGLCSYLLIGFWFQKIEKAQAGMKAFITNRIGDVAFLVGLFLYFSLFDSLNFLAFDKEVATHHPTLTFVTCLFLFLGATGKSAQFPLYVWLPSAMAGPTPVSALIHAATMVTAGVYLIIRNYELWLYSPLALDIVATIGVFTALIGAVGACKAWDVKKILAYSTISQLGYMFLALGSKAFGSALFHLTTHAFFKAGLFLSAGSLIHSLHGEQDIRNMGGLRKKLPITFISFLIGGMALMGIPPLSGFFSKDEILYYAFKQENYFLWFLAMMGAAMTAFYTVRMLYYIFWKKPVSSFPDLHEGTWLTKAPLCILSFLAITAGLLNWPHFLPKVFSHQWLSHFVYWLPTASPKISLEILLAVFSSLLVFLIAFISIFFLHRKKSIQFLKTLLQMDVSLDRAYHSFITQPTKTLSHHLLNYIEISILQDVIFKIGKWIINLKKVFSSVQSGIIQHYLLFLTFGLVIFIFVTLFR